MAKYSLGSRSRANLVGVHHDLCAVVGRAIELTTQDFAVFEGLRSAERQRALVASGMSTTLRSRHLTGHAVDLVPWIGGSLKWEWAPIYSVATAVRQAAQELQVPIRWGGAWDIDLTSSTGPTEQLVAAYVARRKAAGHSAFIDGPHYELPRARYP